MSKKIKLIYLSSMILSMPTLVFAGVADGFSDSKGTIAKVANALLSALAWFGFAIAVGILIFIGIKYVLSGANEKANLKGKFQAYLIGVALIVLCSTIASGVAKIANKDGSNTGGGIVQTGLGLGGITVGGKGYGGSSSTGDKGGTGGKFEVAKNKMAVSGTDGAYFEVEYDGKKYKSTETFTGELSQYVDGIEVGTEVTLKAYPTSESGMEFDCWAIVDDDGNIVEVLTKDLAYTYAMGNENINIQAVYKEKETQSISPDTQIEIGQVTGRAPAKIEVKTESPIAVVAANPEGAEGTYSVSFKNNSNKLGESNGNRDEKLGETYDVSDNGVVGTVHTVDKSASSGKYTINVETNTGNPPQNLSITQYDKNGNSTIIDVPMYYEHKGLYYDSNGNQVATETFSKLDTYAISYDSNRDIDIETNLDVENYSYVVNADCIGGN